MFANFYGRKVFALITLKFSKIALVAAVCKRQRMNKGLCKTMYIEIRTIYVPTVVGARLNRSGTERGVGDVKRW